MTNSWTGTPLTGRPSRKTYGVCGSGSARACLSRMRGKRASPVLRGAGRSNAPGLSGAIAIRVHPVTAYRWLREGYLPPPATRVGGLILIDHPASTAPTGVAVVYARGSSAHQRQD